MDNSNTNQENPSDDKSLIPSELIKKESHDPIEIVECMDIDNEIFPKVEEESIIKNEYNPMKICQGCGCYTTCILQYYHESEHVKFFCSPPCLSLHKKTLLLINPQPNAEPTLPSASALIASPSSSSVKVIDVGPLHVRVCTTCSAIIQINDYSNISWQAREFCNEKCLTRHQARFNSFCIECKYAIVDANNFGKFSMKFGSSIRAFCSKICLEKHKMTLNMCTFCNSSVPIDRHHKYIVPIVDHAVIYKEFCTSQCVKNYSHYILDLPHQSEGENYGNCFVCNLLKYITFRFLHRDIVTYTFCSADCFAHFQCFNKTDAVQCIICKVLYDKTFFHRYCLYDNGVKNFCSENCQTAYYIIARRSVECNNCHAKKYNLDMIQKTFPNKQTIYACSFECLKNSYKSMSRPIVSSASQNDQKQTYGYLKNLMTSQNALNKKCVSPQQNNASTSTDCRTEEKSTQTTPTSKSGPPTSLSIGCTTLQLALPIPVPVPVPVPIFIPTVGFDVEEEISTRLSQIWKEMPHEASHPTNTLSTASIRPTILKTLMKPTTPKIPTTPKALATPKTLTKPTTPKTLTTSKALTKPTMPKTLTPPKILTKPTTPTPPKILTKPTTPKTVTKPSTPKTLTKSTTPKIPKTLTKPTTPKIPKTSKSEDAKNSQRKRKLKKPTERKVPKRDYNFGLVILKRWISTKNTQTEHETLPSRSDLLKTNILKMTTDELQKCLLNFLDNMKRVHSPVTIYIIFLDIQKYLLHNKKSEYIFLDMSFKEFIERFNELTIGFHTIHKLNSKLTEEHLWRTNQLGTHTAHTLINSLIYFNFKLFGLKTVQEHFNLQSMQVTFTKRPILNLPESKLKYAYNVMYSPKTVNNDDGNKDSENNRQFSKQKRCTGFLYEFYMQKCPTIAENDCKSFYLKPELNYENDSPIWFSNETLDEWSIEMMLNRIKMVKEIDDV